ncbi:MAG: DUF2283 domain-containing protein [Dehalococcoidia bacterium]
MRVQLDSEADAVYIQLSDEPVTSTEEIDEFRFVDRDAAGAVRGVELLNVKSGLRVRGLPVAPGGLASALQDVGLLVQDWYWVRTMQMTTQGPKLPPFTVREGASMTQVNRPRTEGPASTVTDNFQSSGAVTRELVTT